MFSVFGCKGEENKTRSFFDVGGSWKARHIKRPRGNRRERKKIVWLNKKFGVWNLASTSPSSSFFFASPLSLSIHSHWLKSIYVKEYLELKENTFTSTSSLVWCSLDYESVFVHECCWMWLKSLLDFIIRGCTIFWSFIIIERPTIRLQYITSSLCVWRLLGCGYELMMITIQIPLKRIS